MDGADGVPGSQDRLADLIDAARAHDEPHVEVFALDALACIAARTNDYDRAAAMTRDLHGEATSRLRAIRRMATHRLDHDAD